ncbi:Uncharacterised protein [Campylobacter sputorum subsp. bubulus]|uniref:Uncharacterized protein n=1 Tax=Campylobacter sputorum subsp. sputorum TaxID=32024 RepID=A0A381DHP4_9BACT|nr:Uncharacterised protein [Campylobacter sputorum subsp. bubulus]SUX10194.1 Uncharacterised protein [Campylobacter sputorum subsp. sputorum]
MTYPEVHSLEKSLVLRDKYKNELSKEQCEVKHI